MGYYVFARLFISCTLINKVPNLLMPPILGWSQEKHLATAMASFANTGVQVTSEDRPYLGTAIDSEELWFHM